MITEDDLKDAIAECQGQRNPNANTCIKLAAFLTIQREMFGQSPQLEENVEKIKPYSFQSANSKDDIINYPTDSEFGRLINGKAVTDVLNVMQELMNTLLITNPELYNFAVRRFNKI